MALEKPNTDLTKTMYFSKFAMGHRDAMRLLQQGKVLGAESEGWRNIAEHCLLAGVMAYKLGQLVNLPQKNLEEVTNAALTHDWNKRLEKEAAKISAEKTESGQMVVSYDPKMVAKQEENKKGLSRVTGADWNDIETWGTEEKILRYIDSCLGTTKEGHAQFQPWRDRLADLAKRHPVINKEQGERMYGMPLYDKLAKVTECVERDLFEEVKKNSLHNSNTGSTSDLSILIELSLAADIAHSAQ